MGRLIVAVVSIGGCDYYIDISMTAFFRLNLLQTNSFPRSSVTSTALCLISPLMGQRNTNQEWGDWFVQRYGAAGVAAKWCRSIAVGPCARQLHRFVRRLLRGLLRAWYLLLGVFGFRLPHPSTISTSSITFTKPIISGHMYFT